MRRDRTIRRHDVAVFLAQLHAHVGVQLEVQRPHLVPQPIELLREVVRRHVVLRRATSRRCRRSRARARPCSTAPRIARSRCASAAKSCASPPTLSRSRASSRDVAITFRTSSMLRQFGLVRVLTELALPVRGFQLRGDVGELLRLLGIRGRDHHERMFEKVELRRSSPDTDTLSKAVAPFASRATASMKRRFARALNASVSSVMNVC